MSNFRIKRNGYELGRDENTIKMKRAMRASKMTPEQREKAINEQTSMLGEVISGINSSIYNKSDEEKRMIELDLNNRIANIYSQSGQIPDNGIFNIESVTERQPRSEIDLIVESAKQKLSNVTASINNSSKDKIYSQNSNDQLKTKKANLILKKNALLKKQSWDKNDKKTKIEIANINREIKKIDELSQGE